MKDSEKDISLSELYNITASDYKDVCVKDLPLTVRQINGLLGAGCATLEKLLSFSENELMGVRNLGRQSVEGIIEFITQMDVEKVQDIKINDRNSGNAYYKKYTPYFISGSFDEIDDDKLDQDIINQYRIAYEETDRDLIMACIEDPDIVALYANMLRMWGISVLSCRNALQRIPSYRLKNKAIGYIYAYYNIENNWGYKLPDDFDYEMSLEAFLKRYDFDDWKYLSRFAEWCSKDIRENTNAFFDDLVKDRAYVVIRNRIDKKTLDEVGAIFGVTRERIRQIEAKTKRKASVWAKNNKILRLMSADLNGKTIMSSEDFVELLGDRGDMLFYLLTDSPEAEIEGFYYNKTYRVFVFGDDLDFVSEEEYVEKLPAVISVNDFESMIETAVKQEGISEDQLRLVFSQQYNLSGEYYRSKHEKASLYLIYTEVLKRHYENGMQFHLDSELETFKKYVSEEYGLDIYDKSNRSVEAILGRIGVLCDRGTIRPKKEKYISDELREKIRKYILEKKNPLIFLNSIYSVFEEELSAFGIDNRYYLQGVLKEEFSNEFYLTRDYVSREPVTSTIYSSVCEFIKKFSYPVSKEEIFKEFPGLSEIMLNFSTMNDRFVMNYFGQYIHLERLKLFDYDKEYLKFVAEKILSDNKPHHEKEFFEYINADNPDLLKRIYITFPYSMFSFLESYFGENYQFSRPYVAKNEVEIGNPFERIKEYVMGEECIDIDDILGMAKELHFGINSILDFLLLFSDTHILISNEQIATLNYIGIDSEKYEQIENSICDEVHDTIPIKDLTCLHRFCSINIPWTDWLVYGLVDKFGSRLEVAPSYNQFRYAVPLISRKGQMDISKYSDIRAESSGNLGIADDLSNIDDLIADLIVEEIEGDFDEF